MSRTHLDAGDHVTAPVIHHIPLAPEIPDDPAVVLPRLRHRCMADITPERIEWLWPGRIARGKTSMIAGQPGLGKSQITASIAATVSTGGMYPDGSRAERGSVIILSAEDDPADTIRPRLDAVGADVSRVHVVESVIDGDSDRMFCLQEDLGRLGSMIQDIGDVRLVIIDPISAYLGRGLDSNNNSDIRGLMATLAGLAAATGAAILCVSHLNKTTTNSNALERVTGSLAFVAAVRGVYIVVRDPDVDERRLLLTAKNNIGPDQGDGLAYEIEPTTIDDGIDTSRVAWCTDTVTTSLAQAMTPADDERTERTDAAAWLREVLEDGPRSAKDVKSMARDAGFAVRTVERARPDAKVRSRREGFGRDATYMWELTDMPATPPPSLHDGEHGEHGAHGVDSDSPAPAKTDDTHARHHSREGEHGAHDSDPDPDVEEF